MAWHGIRYDIRHDYTFYYITTYKCCNKNKIALDRVRTDDLVVNSHTLYLLSYKGLSKYKTCKKMREAGFEPALPEERRLKRRVLDHSTIRASIVTNIVVTSIFGFGFFLFCFV